MKTNGLYLMVRLCGCAQWMRGNGQSENLFFSIGILGIVFGFGCGKETPPLIPDVTLLSAPFVTIRNGETISLPYGFAKKFKSGEMVYEHTVKGNYGIILTDHPIGCSTALVDDRVEGTYEATRVFIDLPSFDVGAYSGTSDLGFSYDYNRLGYSSSVGSFSVFHKATIQDSSAHSLLIDLDMKRLSSGSTVYEIVIKGALKLSICPSESQ